MPNYIYTAKNTFGQVQNGTLFAQDKAQLIAILQTRSLSLSSYSLLSDNNKTKKKLSFNITLPFLNRISLVDKMFFARQLTVMLKAGVALPKAMNLVASQIKNPRFKAIIQGMRDELEKGATLSSTLEKHTDIFNDLFVNMVRVGEASGTLESVLELLADQLKKDNDLVSKVRGAMIYPGVILSAMVVIGLLMVRFVIPSLVKIFTETGVKLPFLTQVIVTTVNIVNNYFIFIIIGIIGIIYAFTYSLKHIYPFKKFLHALILKSPILGKIAKKVNSARVARILSSLLESGVSITKSLEITGNTLSNVWMKESFIVINDSVSKGKKLSTMFYQYPTLYPSLLGQLIEVGEETGKMTEILKELADFYEGEVEDVVKNLSSIIEPILMLIIGAAVGVFAIAMFMPMYSLLGSV